MPARTIAAVLVVLAMIGGCLAWALTGRERSPLRSLHSEPARVVPAQTVAVTSEGKLFHAAACPFIHGPGTFLPAADAVRQGYTPCTRCLKGLTTGG